MITTIIIEAKVSKANNVQAWQRSLGTLRETDLLSLVFVLKFVKTEKSETFRQKPEDKEFELFGLGISHNPRECQAQSEARICIELPPKKPLIKIAKS